MMPWIFDSEALDILSMFYVGKERKNFYIKLVQGVHGISGQIRGRSKVGREDGKSEVQSAGISAQMR